MNVIFDMETSDPDDALTLCFLAGHPIVKLRAVTVTPGSKDQIGLVKHLLKKLDRTDVLVGSRTVDTQALQSHGAGRALHPKICVSEFHYRWLGKIEPEIAPDAVEILHQTYQSFPDCTLLTGAALHNPKNFLNKYPETKIPLWVGQGGFAGEGVVPPELQLLKFSKLKTCPTFNFNGDVVGAKLMLSSSQISRRLLVSKNVCHGVVYTPEMHEQVKPHKDNNPGIALIYQGMTVYLKKSLGKAFHDPLAACTMINPKICEFKEVEVYREKGEWGSVLKEGTNTFISISVDFPEFVRTLVGL